MPGTAWARATVQMRECALCWQQSRGSVLHSCLHQNVVKALQWEIRRWERERFLVLLKSGLFNSDDDDGGDDDGGDAGGGDGDAGGGGDDDE